MFYVFIVVFIVVRDSGWYILRFCFFSSKFGWIVFKENVYEKIFFELKFLRVKKIIWNIIFGKLIF